MRVQRFDSPQLRSIYLAQSSSPHAPVGVEVQDQLVEGPRSQTDLISKGLATANKPPEGPGPSRLGKIGDAVTSALMLSAVGAVGGAFVDMFLNLGHTFDSVISLGAVSGPNHGPWLAMGVGAALCGAVGAVTGYQIRRG